MTSLWLDFQNAFSHPATVGMVIGVVGVLALSALIIAVLKKTHSVSASHIEELIARTKSWAIIVPVILLPLLAGSRWVIIAITILSLLCYREYSRMTGLFRERMVSAAVVIEIVALCFASLDNWQRLFEALVPIGIALIAMVAIMKDQPSGYIQRVSLAIFGYLLIGYGLGHLGFLANDALGRPMILMLLVCVQLNDVFAFICGRLLGRHKLAPNTSPGKTIEGSAGAVVLTTTLTAIVGHYVFKGTPLDSPFYLIVLGLIVSIVGQFGDLTLSSIKRDVGVKDSGVLIPGHGGLLDRCNSLLLVAPGFFYFVQYINGMDGRLPMHLLIGN
ncbi:MAG: phosphatidate cytidylyltransferase [Candidatus Sumerlaeota bacterium]